MSKTTYLSGFYPEHLRRSARRFFDLKLFSRERTLIAKFS
jgi:hypothetical protein